MDGQVIAAEFNPGQAEPLNQFEFKSYTSLIQRFIGERRTSHSRMMPLLTMTPSYFFQRE
jgi:hypothetical protein